MRKIVSRKTLATGKVAYMTVWPSQIEARIEDAEKSIGGSVSTPAGRESMLGHILNRLIDQGVETLEIRVENTED